MTPWKFLAVVASLFAVFVIILAIYINTSVLSDMPSIEQLENPRQNLATQILSADGEVIDHFYIQKRVSSSIDSIPKDFINALVAVEDREFYHHWGVHTVRVFKALIKNVFTGRREGASTITMQLARNLYFTQEMSLTRKLKDAFTAIQIEKTYTKNEILEMYINTVAFGRGAYGIQVASDVYFDKNPLELTLAECAFLVGVLKAPEHYNGVINYERAIQRRNLVLDLMRQQGYISDIQYVNAAQEPINLANRKNQKIGRSNSIAPHFVEMIRQNLGKNKLKDKDLYRDGLVIYTTLNARIQRYAQAALEEHLGDFQKAFDRSWSWTRNKDLLETLIKEAIHKRADYIAADEGKKQSIERSLRSNRSFIDSVKNALTTIQTGLVVIDPFDGSILALVGSSPKFMKEHSDSKYSLNHVSQIQRQPGSTFKPFVYASALDHGMTPESVIECGPYTYKMPSGESWSPRGSAQCEPGEKVSLYEALLKSINTVSARLITQVTNPQDVISIASRMGISSRLQAVPALSLGAGGEVVPLDMVSAFGTFVNNGVHVKPYAVERVEDQYGNMILQNKKRMEATDVLSAKICNQMIYMMQGVVNYGTGYKVREYFKGISAAGKTGTTNDYADAWFIGYTPQLVAGVWVGFDDRRITFQSTMGYASSAAAPIWGRLMAKIYADEILPYKQKEFSYMVGDSSKSAATDNAIIKNLSTTRQREIPEDGQPAPKQNKNNQERDAMENHQDQQENVPHEKSRFPRLPKPETNKK